VIDASGLRVRRQEHVLVEVDRFSLMPGEVHVLLGANGAGKSTLLKALNGLEEAEGTLEFEGRRVESAAQRLALRRATAAVFQKPHLLGMSVWENVASGLRLRGVRRGEVRSRVAVALDLLGIAHLADRKSGRLSGGEAQRVSIARALAVEPLALFLDEPLAALDPPTRKGLLEDLLAIFAEGSMAVAWVTHDRDEALSVGDRVSFLEGGRLVQSGGVVDVFAHPLTSSFAGFLGLDTYLDGVILKAEDGSVRLCLDGGVEIACGEGPDGPAAACLPPEDVVLLKEPSAQGSSSLRNQLEGSVKSMTPAGRLLHVVVDTGHIDVAALVTRASADELGLAPGVPVVAAFKAAAVHPIPRRE
jgi:tungstate transport system ATP-binding protein